MNSLSAPPSQMLNRSSMEQLPAGVFLRAISDCNRVLVRATDESSLLTDICRIICDGADYRMAWVGYAQNDADKTVRPVAWAGMEEGYLGTTGMAWSDTERGRGPTGTAIRNARTVVSQNMETDDQVRPWRGEMSKRGYRSSIALPLMDETGIPFGALTIYAAVPEAFTPDEIRLLEELAGDLAFGITALRDRTARKRNEAIKASRLHIMQFAATHSLEELLEETLSEAERLTKSMIGFYHLVAPDQKPFLLRNWSRRTKREFCRGEGKGRQQSIRQPEVLGFCLHERKPAIYNNYASLRQRRGFGHAVIDRELMVPVLRNEKIVAILGVGNKPEEYVADDVQVVSLLAGLAWEIVERKRAEEALRGLNLELEARVRQRTKELAASEQRFRTLYDLAPVSIWQEDWSEVIPMIQSLQAGGVTEFGAWFAAHPDFVARALAAVKIQDVNQWTLGMFKANTKADLLASLGTVFASPDTLPGFVGELIALAQGRTQYHTDMALTTVTGEHIHSLLAMSLPQPGITDGQVLVSLIDITDRQRAEAALRASQERMRLFFERQLVGTAITATEKGWVQVNDKLCAMLGYSRKEMLGLTWSEMTHPDDLADDEAQFNRLLKGEIDSYSLEKRFLRKDGSVIFTCLSVGCVRHADGSVDYVLALLEDITAQKRAENAVHKLNQDLQQRASELQAANQELHRLNRAFIGRELRMAELKEKLRTSETTRCRNPEASRS